MGRIVWGRRDSSREVEEEGKGLSTDRLLLPHRGQRGHCGRLLRPEAGPSCHHCAPRERLPARGEEAAGGGGRGAAGGKGKDPGKGRPAGGRCPVTPPPPRQEIVPFSSCCPLPGTRPALGLAELAGGSECGGLGPLACLCLLSRRPAGAGAGAGDGRSVPASQHPWHLVLPL